MGLESQKATCGVQITYDTSTGDSSYAAFSGPLLETPGQIIFDNQSTVAVTVSQDGVNDWKTFAAGQGIILDMRANILRPASDFTFQIGTQFYANSGAGTGFFYISYLYAS